MAQNRIRPPVGPSQEHLWRTTLGGRKRRISILHILLANNGLQSLRTFVLYWVRHPRRRHDLILGKCSLVDGRPVQLGQASRTIRNLYHLTRTHLSHTSGHVPRRGSRNPSHICPRRP